MLIISRQINPLLTLVFLNSFLNHTHSNMKKLLVVLLCLSGFSLSYGQDVAKYLKAKELSNNKQYTQAQVLYKDLINELDLHKKNMQAQIVVGYLNNTLFVINPNYNLSADSYGELMQAYPYYKNLNNYNLDRVDRLQLENIKKYFHLHLLEVGTKKFQRNQLKEAKELLTAYTETTPTDYVGYDMLGQTLGAMGKDAVSAFKMSIALYNEYPPEKPNLLAGYTYYRLAASLMDNSSEALKYVVQGIKFANTEYNKLDESAKPAYLNTKNTLINDLTLIELSIYLEDGNDNEEAVSKFKEAINRDPDNYTLRVSYASLLEKNYSEEAIKQYKYAISIDSTEHLAYYNLGALYFNKAGALIGKALQIEDDDMYNKLKSEANDLLKQAYPYLKKALTIEPYNRQTLISLKEIASRLELMDDYKMYKEKLNEL